MELLAATLLLTLSFVTNQQEARAGANSSASGANVQAIIKHLEPYNPLRRSLERGERGSGIHRGWMDKMRQHNIKHASFTLNFRWNGGAATVKIKDVSLLHQYYQYDSQIKDRDLLRRIRADGLEQELREVAISKAQATIPRIMADVMRTVGGNVRRAHGTVYVNLLDDEALPVLDDLPYVDW